MVDYPWLLGYIEAEIGRLQRAALGYQTSIVKYEEIIKKHRIVLDGDMFIENKWQYGNGIKKAEEAILNLQVMLSQIGNKITKLKETQEEITKLA